MPTTSTIPDALLAKLIALRPTLEREGAVIHRREPDRRGGCRLRYKECGDGGVCVHRSLALGQDPALGAAVTALMQSWRQERRAREDTERNQARLIALHKRQGRKLVQELVAAHGGGERTQRRAALLFDRAAENGPAAAWVLVRSGALLARRRPGRPRKRLW